MDIKDTFAQESIKAYNEGYRVGCRETEGKHIETIRMLSDRISELEDKHWEECRQIALYDDEVKQLKKELYGNCTMMKSSS
jgi:hypothetical protein